MTLEYLEQIDDDAAGAWELELQSASVARGIPFREEIRRHINSTVEDLVKPFTCVVDLTPSGDFKSMSEDRMGAILEVHMFAAK